MGDKVLSERERRALQELEQDLRENDRRLDDMLRLFVCDGWVQRLRWAAVGKLRMGRTTH